MIYDRPQHHLLTLFCKCPLDYQRRAITTFGIKRRKVQEVNIQDIISTSKYYNYHLNQNSKNIQRYNFFAQLAAYKKDVQLTFVEQVARCIYNINSRFFFFFFFYISYKKIKISNITKENLNCVQKNENLGIWRRSWTN